MKAGVPIPSATRQALVIYLVSYLPPDSWQGEPTLLTLVIISVGSLTHLNFAFAYLDPDTYEVVPMESDMSWDLFDDVTAAKDTSSDLKVFVSIGGWSFSDNDTDTQPLFGEIAADADNRSQFATNVLKFLNWYGFDGVDIDWYVWSISELVLLAHQIQYL
jgi:chitinase